MFEGEHMSAAKKAWKTRRLNAKHRTIAAVKANITRGAKGRSNASKKAWCTRRAKTLA